MVLAQDLSNVHVVCDSCERFVRNQIRDCEVGGCWRTNSCELKEHLKTKCGKTDNKSGVKSTFFAYLLAKSNSHHTVMMWNANWFHTLLP